MKTDDSPFEYVYDPDAASGYLPWDRDAPEGRRQYTTLAPAIETILKRLKIDAVPWLDALAARWPQILPPGIAACTRPVKWETGTLYVEVAGSAKLFELRRFKQREMEQAVRDAIGGERDLRHIHLIPGNRLQI